MQMLGHTVRRLGLGLVGIVLAVGDGESHEGVLVSRSYGKEGVEPAMEWMDPEGLLIDPVTGPVPEESIQGGMTPNELALFRKMTRKRVVPVSAVAKKDEG